MLALLLRMTDEVDPAEDVGLVARPRAGRHWVAGAGDTSRNGERLYPPAASIAARKLSRVLLPHCLGSLRAGTIPSDESMDPSKFANIKDRPWPNAQSVASAQWKCGYCNREVASNQGLNASPNAGAAPVIRFCSFCNGPTFFSYDGRDYSPGALPGRTVDHVPAELNALFTEAREATAGGAYTAAVLTCRKILMHIAVEKKAKEGLTFLDYVNHLAASGYVPPDGKVWVDYIRKRGNEANHQIVLMDRIDAVALVGFVEMLLRLIYELPSMVPPLPPSPATP
jgi:uncharacterized protein DUF4145